MKTNIKNIHMTGIGGSGMSGIAEVLINLGYSVSGSDLKENQAVKHLQNMGAKIYLGHAAQNVKQAEVLVKSTAIDSNNPEVLKAKEMGIPVIPRAEMLAELMRLKTGIAVAGTHGKTTTTSMLGTVFKEAGLDPTVIIGGRLKIYGSNALMGQGEYLIAEADESDGSFLCLFPIMGIVTNVDADHLDYYSDLQAIEEAFVRFMNKMPFYGVNVVCADDPVVKSLLPQVKRPFLTYGFAPENDIQAEIFELGTKSRFKIYLKQEFWGEVQLSQPGEHNILNALGVIGICLQVGMTKEKIIRGLEGFGGVGRRMELKGSKYGVQVLDDYGHHPREIEVTLTAVRKCYPNKRIIAVFQPHRFSRTQALFGDFCRVFNAVDILFLTEIYPAAEDPIPGVSGLSLAQGIRQVGSTEVVYSPDFKSILENLKQVVREGDVLLTLGAGDVWKVGERYLLEE